MSIVKSLSVDKGDLFYIRHDSDNFTIIDCNLLYERREEILNELKSASGDKGIKRFISTHPDKDHIEGLEHIDDLGLAWNFYCVKNDVQKDDGDDSFKRYKKLRDNIDRSFYIYKGCSRCWMNQSNAERDSAGIEILWPVVESELFKDQLASANRGESPNNISPIIRYTKDEGAVVVWMGDLESDFLEGIADEVDLSKTDILFAPHHGRKSGHVPKRWLDLMNPKVIVVGEAPSDDLCYYSGFNTITQNTAGDIEFECLEGVVHVRVSSLSYSAPFLQDLGGRSVYKDDGTSMWYIGSFETHHHPMA